MDAKFDFDIYDTTYRNERELVEEFLKNKTSPNITKYPNKKMLSTISFDFSFNKNIYEYINKNMSFKEKYKVIKPKNNFGLTIYPNGGHDSWTKTYENPQLWEWVFDQSKSKNIADQTAYQNTLKTLNNYQ